MLGAVQEAGAAQDMHSTNMHNTSSMSECTLEMWYSSLCSLCVLSAALHFVCLTHRRRQARACHLRHWPTEDCAFLLLKAQHISRVVLVNVASLFTNVDST